MVKDYNFPEAPKSLKVGHKSLWKNNEMCPVCGAKADPKIRSCETGYNYDSHECAEKHVKELEPEGGY